MSSLLGDGDRAVGYLNTLLNTYVQANTMYRESGPVIETPLSGAQSVLDMLLSSWGDRIRVFPAVPSTWDDVAFHRLVTEGGFQISAVRRSGTTEFVHVRSTAGEPCRIQPGGLPQPWPATTAPSSTKTETAPQTRRSDPSPTTSTTTDFRN